MYQPRDDNDYQPVNDYVKWLDLLGISYRPEQRYLTLEIMVREKTEQSYKDCNIHRNEDA